MVHCGLHVAQQRFMVSKYIHESCENLTFFQAFFFYQLIHKDKHLFWHFFGEKNQCSCHLFVSQYWRRPHMGDYQKKGLKDSSNCQFDLQIKSFWIYNNIDLMLIFWYLMSEFITCRSLKMLRSMVCLWWGFEKKRSVAK